MSNIYNNVIIYKEAREPHLCFPNLWIPGIALRVPRE
jgi:hypothetical protein